MAFMYTERIQKLRQQMREDQLDAFLVTDPINIKYLSGFSGDTAGVQLVTADNNWIITDSRFVQYLEEELPDQDNIITRSYLGTVCDLVKELSIKRLGFEDTITYTDYEFLREQAECELVPENEVIEWNRTVKSPAELDIIRQSCQLAGKGFQFVLDNIKPGMTEQEMSNELDYFMKKHGAQGASFETIFASGENTVKPHATASKKKIQVGEPVTLDFGYFYDDYTSDVTRTFGIGAQSDKFKEIYQVVLDAQIKTIEAVKEGVTAAELDHVGRQYITDQGYGEYFTHGMGHGIGLDIHENPYISRSVNDAPLGKFAPKTFVANQILTIEPGIYIPGVGGVRIEDDVLVTKDGYEVLTDFSKKYQEVPAN